MGVAKAPDLGDFGSLLRGHRLSAELTQEALAERAGLGVRSIQGLESGESRPRPETARRLIAALGLGGDLRALFEATARCSQRHGPVEVEHLTGPDEPSMLRTNLPLRLTSFVGRERELSSVEGLLQSTRLLTLVGSGGCGKTRLAYEVAARQVGTYRDGVWVVELASVADPALVAGAVVSALGLRISAARSPLTALSDHLRPRQLLLVLDNCEHLVEACARVVEALLPDCPCLTVLATSRGPLRIDGEVIYQVPSLSTPPVDRSSSVEDLARYESVRLLVERARAVKPGFDLTTANALAVSEVCWRLDGIPLAIELAAARVSALAVEEIACRLKVGFGLLTRGSRTALPRHQTLRAAIDWSYDLVSGPQRLLLCRLAVFVGSFTLEAAEHVCSDERLNLVEVVDLVADLVDGSLLQLEKAPREARYRQLETIRQYAWQKLLDSGEAVRARDRHRDWCLELVRRAEPELRGPESVLWLDRLETEHDNLRAALSWCLEQDVETGLEIVGRILWFWDYHCHFREGSRWATELLARSSAETLQRARALRTAAMMARGEGSHSRAAELAEESIRLCRKLGDMRELGRSLCIVADSIAARGEIGSAEQLFVEAIAISREVEDDPSISDALWCLADLAYGRGDRDRARVLIAESLAIARQIGHLHGVAIRLLFFAKLELPDGDLVLARSLVEEGLALFRQESRGWSFGLSFGLVRLGFVSLLEGDLVQAKALLAESLTGFQQIGGGSLANFLELAAELEVRRGERRRGARLFGALDAESRRGEQLFRPSIPGTYDAVIAEARGVLGKEAFTQAWTEGQAMTVEQAVEYALKDEIWST